MEKERESSKGERERVWPFTYWVAGARRGSCTTRGEEHVAVTVPSIGDRTWSLSGCNTVTVRHLTPPFVNTAPALVGLELNSEVVSCLSAATRWGRSTAGAEITIPSEGSPELPKVVSFELGVGQNSGFACLAYCRGILPF